MRASPLFFLYVHIPVANSWLWIRSMDVHHRSLLFFVCALAAAADAAAAAVFLLLYLKISAEEEKKTTIDIVPSWMSVHKTSSLQCVCVCYFFSLRKIFSRHLKKKCLKEKSEKKIRTGSWFHVGKGGILTSTWDCYFQSSDLGSRLDFLCV